MKYVNHACDANAMVVPVRVEQPNVPRVALISRKAIHPGQQVTLDYAHVSCTHLCKEEDEKGMEKREREERNVVQGQVPCLCGSIHCRQVLPLDPTFSHE